VAADPEQLLQLPGFDQETVDAVLAAARQQVTETGEASQAEGSDVEAAEAAEPAQEQEGE
jgi:hypothetical protein